MVTHISRQDRSALPRLLLAVGLLGLACSTLTSGWPLAPAPTSTPTLSPTPPPTSTPLPSATRRPSATPAPIPTNTPTSGYGLRPGDVTFHPDPQLYSGDIVSLEIDAANADPAWQEALVQVHAGALDGPLVGTANFGRFGIGGRAQATFTWVWDTAGLEGPQTLVIAVMPGRREAEALRPLDLLTVTATLLSADQRPMPEPLARWAQVETACCVFHYLTGTAAERDIDLILQSAQAGFELAQDQLSVTPEAKASFTLLGRLLGHGGFAAQEITLSYLDRNPAGNNLETVFTHEATHLLDQALADVKPALMTEGLAVYAAGGHFKPEDLDRRAAALLATGRYIPLDELARDFYPAQHEIGYLEAGAFVKHLVDTYGWERFAAFYGAFEPADSEARMLDEGLQANFGRGLAEAEADWLAALRARPVDTEEVADLRLTVELYDTLRRYQRMYDPAAHFLNAWLPNGPDGRQRGIVADFVRHPSAPENVALEAMLAEAQRALVAGEYDAAAELVRAAGNALDAAEAAPKGSAPAGFADPLAQAYLDVALQMAQAGYEAQTIALSGDTASVTAIRDWPKLERLSLRRTDAGWRLGR